MSSIIIIPARYRSTRFPGKVLYPLRGIPVIQHVYKNSKLSKLADDVIVATDSEEIFNNVISFGGKAIMTDRRHQSGTDRIAEVASSIDYDIIVNVQGDEPLIKPEMIDKVILLLEDKKADIGTLIKRITSLEEISNPNVVKVVTNNKGFALYFSRAPIPYCRDEWKEDIKLDEIFDKYVFYKHIGIYSYRREILLSLSNMKQTILEKAEKLEQLRALENGFMIKTAEVFDEVYGIDTPQDIGRVERCLSTSL